MKRIKPSLVLAAAAVVGMALWAGAYVEQTGSKMAVAADRFLDSLTKDQAEKAVFDFDSPERINWHFIPRERKGIPIKELTPEQRALAFGLISTGTGGGGYLKATTIMSLEQVLQEIEKGSGPVRDPERYFLTIFGTPVRSRQVGLAGRGAPPLAQLRARGRQGRRGHSQLLRRQSRPRSGKGRGRACARWPIARTRPSGCSRRSTATRRRSRSSPPRPPRRSAPRARPSPPPTPPRGSATPS